MCDYLAPALAPALKYPVSHPNVEFIPSSLLSLVIFSCMHILNELLEQFCVYGVLRGPYRNRNRRSKGNRYSIFTRLNVQKLHS